MEKIKEILMVIAFFIVFFILVSFVIALIKTIFTLIKRKRDKSIGKVFKENFLDMLLEVFIELLNPLNYL